MTSPSTAYLSARRTHAPAPLPAVVSANEVVLAGNADGCPECVVNVEIPRSVVVLKDGHRAAYVCSDCGHAWTTDWRD